MGARSEAEELQSSVAKPVFCCRVKAWLRERIPRLNSARVGAQEV